MNLPRSSWKLPVVCAVALVAVLRFGAPTITPAAPSATPGSANYAAAVAALKTPDALFEYINKNATVDDIELDGSLPREAQIAQARELMNDKIALLRPAIDAFLKQYPQDPRRWEVQFHRVLFLKDAEGISNDEYVHTLTSISTASDASADVRHRARAVLLRNTLEEINPSKGLTPALEKDLASYEQDFPDDESGRDLVELRVHLLRTTAPDRINATLEALAKSPNKSTARVASVQLAMATQPLDLKFDSATDGKAVDFTKLRGQVVLLDFWATWCVPCMIKIPALVEINDKYKGKGYQLVGVSLDEDQAAMLKTVKARKMEWPEYFDGKVWNSEVSRRFGVSMLPATWLVDKKGFAHAVEPGADLDAEIARLLAEKS